MSAAYELIKHDDFITDALVGRCLVPIVTKEVNPNYASFLTKGHRVAIRGLICRHKVKANKLRDSLLNLNCFRRFTRRVGVEELKEFKKHLMLYCQCVHPDSGVKFRTAEVYTGSPEVKIVATKDLDAPMYCSTMT